MIFAHRLIAALFALTLWHGGVRAADPPELTKLPWHLADVYLDLGTHESIRAVSVSFQLFDDIPDGGHAAFLVPMCATLSGVRCYAGSITQGFPIGTIEDHSAIVHPGHIFTQFGSRSPDRVLPTKEGFSFLSDHEGDHASVRARGKLKKGVYTLRLVKRETSKVAFAKDTCIVDMTVLAADGKEAVVVGGLRLPKSDFSIDGRMACFCEITQGWDAKALKWRRATDNPPHGIPHFRYAVGGWRIDDEPVAPKSVEAYFSKSVPQRATVHLRGGTTDPKLLAALDNKLDSEDTLVIAVQAENIVRKGKEVTLSADPRFPEYGNAYVVEELKAAK